MICKILSIIGQGLLWCIIVFHYGSALIQVWWFFLYCIACIIIKNVIRPEKTRFYTQLWKHRNDELNYWKHCLGRKTDVCIQFIIILLFKSLTIDLMWLNSLFFSYNRNYIRDGTILWCIDVSQYIMFQYVYRYCKLSIDTSIYRCITVYWSIKHSVKSVKIFKMTFLLKRIWEKAFHYCKKIKSLLLGIDHRNAQVYLISNDVSWYRDTFGVMHRYFYTLYRPISKLYASVCFCNFYRNAQNTGGGNFGKWIISERKTL